jgi:hypothetical protein
MPKLDEGDRLPSITADVAGDGTMSLPDDVEGSRSILLFYRGHW